MPKMNVDKLFGASKRRIPALLCILSLLLPYFSFPNYGHAETIETSEISESKPERSVSENEETTGIEEGSGELAYLEVPEEPFNDSPGNQGEATDEKEEKDTSGTNTHSEEETRAQPRIDFPIGMPVTSGNIQYVVIGRDQDVTQVEAIGFDREITRTLTIPSVIAVIPGVAHVEVVSIRERAFEGLGLEELQIAEGSIEIKERAFANNSLSNVHLNGVRRIGNEAFQNNPLTALNLTNANNLESIGERAFDGGRLGNLQIATGPVRIEERAFADNALTTINLNGVSQIGDEAFQDNPLRVVNLTNATRLVSIGKRAFANAAMVVSLPTSIRHIGERAFADNETLSQINFPEGGSFDFLGERLFDNSNLSMIFVSNEAECQHLRQYLTASVMAGITDITTMMRLDSASYAEDISTNMMQFEGEQLSLRVSNVFYRFIDGNADWVPAPVMWVKDNQILDTTGYRLDFDHLSLLDSGVYQARIELQENGYYYLDKIELTVERFLTYTFHEHADGTTTATVNGVNRNYREEVRDVFIPDQVINYEQGWTMPSTVNAIAPNAFLGNVAAGLYLNSVRLPDTLEEIGVNAFTMNRLTELQLPEGLVTIGESAFSRNNLTSLTIPASVEQIGGSILSFNTLLEEVTFLSTDIEVGTFLFGGCNRLSRIMVPKNDDLEAMTEILSSTAMSQLGSTFPLLLSEEGMVYSEGTLLNHSVNLGDSIQFSTEGVPYQLATGGVWNHIAVEWFHNQALRAQGTNLEIESAMLSDAGNYFASINHSFYAQDLPTIRLAVDTSRIPDVDPDNPAIKPDAPLNPNSGALSIRYVSAIEFRRTTFSPDEQQLQALPNIDSTGATMPHLISVQDTRAAAERNGWRLSVRQTNDFLSGTSIELSPYVHERNQTRFGVQTADTMVLNDSLQNIAWTTADEYEAGVLSIAISGHNNTGLTALVPARAGIGESETTMMWNLQTGP
ncbi:leucine-rich repeat protein [Enterococcus sp. DIV0876]|uniref:leucine-rich repeat protein n=1 Tax=Enterococcus sp. DIV0876 TaxID=2774633 RepID=UPI003D2FA93A